MNHFQQYLVEEFKEDYEEGLLTRRDALKMIAAVTGSLILANSILAACAPVAETEATISPLMSTRPAETVSPTDPALQAQDVQFPSGAEQISAYLAYPSGSGRSPVVLVCHENRGLNEHIKDVTRRLAVAGYCALAVDLLSRSGGSASLGPDQVPGALSRTPPEQFVQDFIDGWRYLGGQPYADTERTGMVGFCFGGGVTWLMATRMPELRAAVPFYGPHPPVEDVPNIQAAVLGIYGELDQRINQGIPAIEEAMALNGKIFEKVIYPGADHAFHNDTSPRYNAEAARDAWQRTLDWFATYLS